MGRFTEMTDRELAAEHRRMSALKVWKGPNGTLEIEQEMKRRRKTELPQDSYYYGTASDLRGL